MDGGKLEEVRRLLEKLKKKGVEGGLRKRTKKVKSTGSKKLDS